jgi:hypothetical protein
MNTEVKKCPREGKATGSKVRPKDHWFLECKNPFTNESVAYALAERALGDMESKIIGMEGSDGKKHDVFRVPSDFVQKFVTAKRTDPLYKFKIFTRAAGSEGVIHPADFVEERYETQKMLEMKKGLKAQIARKKKEAAKTSK